MQDHSPVSDQPDVGTESQVLSSNRADALSCADPSNVEVCGTDVPVLPAPVERDVRRHSVTGERVETVLRVVQLGTGNATVQSLHLARRTVDDCGTRVDNGGYT